MSSEGTATERPGGPRAGHLWLASLVAGTALVVGTIDGNSPDQSPATASPGTPQSISLDVHDDAVSGPDLVEVDLGTEVTLHVTADVADEVHVHGYDMFATTTPGETVTLSLDAGIAGRFDVELERSRLPLLRLQVQ